MASNAQTQAAPAAPATTPEAPPQAETKKDKERAPAPAGELNEAQLYDLSIRKAKAYATSDLVPVVYREKWIDGKNENPGAVANCVIALNLAKRLGADELMVMQNLYIVHGNPGWSSKFLVASVNMCGRFTALDYEIRGDKEHPEAKEFACRAFATERATGKRLEGEWITWAMVKAEGWDKKSGSKWLTMPGQMFRYRSAAFWQRTFAPELSMGLMAVEDLEDTPNLNAAVAATETDIAERKALLESIAQVNIKTPAAVASTLSAFGYDAATNPERLPLSALRTIAAGLNIRQAEPATEPAAVGEGPLFGGR